MRDFGELITEIQTLPLIVHTARSPARQSTPYVE